MNEEHINELWERLASATNIKHLPYDEAVTIGSVFGEMKEIIKEQEKRIGELRGRKKKSKFIEDEQRRAYIKSHREFMSKVNPKPSKEEREKMIEQCKRERGML